MAKNSLGRIGFVFKGDYNNNTIYAPMDVVYYEGSSYICIKETINNLPNNTEYWHIFSKKADTENIEKKLEFLESEFDINTVSGTSIHITDSAAAPMKISPRGNDIVQDTRDGYNLFNVNDTKAVSSGITVDEEDWITITCDNSSGTSAIYQNYFTNNLNLKENTKYNIIAEIKKVSGTGSIQIVSSSSTSQFDQSMGYLFSNLSNGQTVQLNKLTKSDFTNTTQGIRTFCSFNAGESGSITFRISVLEDTTITSDNFVYVKFGKSPSLNYPSELKYVGVSYESYNKFTLGKGTYTNIGITVNYNNSEFSINGTTNSNGNILNARDEIGFAGYRLIGTFPAGKYIFKSELVSGNVNLPSGVNFALYLRKTDKTMVYDSSGHLSNYIEITLTEETTLYAQFFVNGAGAVFNNCLVRCQIIKGTEDKEYLPYGPIGGIYNVNSKNSDASLEQNYPLDLTNHPLYSEKDYIYKKDNKWYVHNEFDRYDFTGLEQWSKHETTKNNAFYLAPLRNPIKDKMKLPENANTVLEIYSNRLLTDTLNNTVFQNQSSISFSPSGDIYIGTTLNGISTLDAFTTFLQNSPTYMIYPLATPTETEITDSLLISQLEALLNSQSYKGVTNINSEAPTISVAELNLDVSYYISNAIRINNLEKAILSLGGNI